MVKLFRFNGMYCWEKPIENTHPPVFTADSIAAAIMTAANFFWTLILFMAGKNVLIDVQNRQKDSV